MRYEELTNQISLPVFSFTQVEHVFAEPVAHLRLQLKRWVDAGKLVRLKRGVYQFPERQIEEFTLGTWLYAPSYISMESALQSYGIIPDVPMATTLVTTTTTKHISLPQNRFVYAKIKPSFYWGFVIYPDVFNPQMTYQMAEPEKALLDWIYLRRINSLEDSRVDLTLLNRHQLRQYAREFPEWVRKVSKL
jgi:hypothetical protein